MTTRKYDKRNCDLNLLRDYITLWFKKNFYQVHHLESNNSIVIQATKENTARTLAGARRAFNLTLNGNDKEFTVDVSLGRWAENLVTVGIVGILMGPLGLLGSGVVAGWSKVEEKKIWEMIGNQIALVEAGNAPLVSAAASKGALKKSTETLAAATA
jgi:hypothetical protein